MPSSQAGTKSVMHRLFSLEPLVRVTAKEILMKSKIRYSGEGGNPDWFIKFSDSGDPMDDE
jgi:hypothetical protein